MTRDMPSHKDGWDETRETIDGFRTVAQSFYPGRYPHNYTYPVKYEGPSQQSFQEMQSSQGTQDRLTAYGTAELFRESVETARLKFQQSLAGSEKVHEAIKPNLTIDLKRREISELRDEVVDILKKDVESLKLSHNQIWHIPYKFEECTPLKFLNLRCNIFKEFPKALYKLPLLEVLDLSCNKLSRIPDEIKNMKALRVFSVADNKIEDVPACLVSMNKFTQLRLINNPLKPGLKRIMDDFCSSPEAAVLNANERDTLLTRRIKKYLQSGGVTKEPGEESSSEGPLDTPRQPKRNLSLRFPVKPSTSVSESTSNARSAGFQRPPIPTRSHYRVASGQNDFLQAAVLRRPGIAPLAINNERNRSNSESVLQATQNTRIKRMGMVTKKNPDIGAFDEARANRNSLHFRGQSHGSVLKDKQGTVRNGGGNSYPSPREHERQKATLVRRLSSLPEHKRVSQSLDSIIGGAKGVLYALHQVHQHISSLIHVIHDGTSERSNLEMVYHNASTHLEHLDQELHGYDCTPHDKEKEKGRLNHNVSYACSTCIVAYRQVGTALLSDISRLIADGDQRYIRTLLLLLYGSLVEARNACLDLGIRLESKKVQPATHPRIPTIHEEGDKRDRSITPTRERPNLERRWRNGNTIQQPGNLNLFNSAANTQNSVQLFFNGRSRSNSRTATLNGSTTSSIANTPRSGDSFNVPGTPRVRSRSNSAMAAGPFAAIRPPVPDDPEKEAQFERIFLGLSSAIEKGLDTLPKAQMQFLSCLDVAQKHNSPRKIIGLWNELVHRSDHCSKTCETLKDRLSNIKLHDPNNARRAKDFWPLCMTFINSVVDLLTGIRAAKHNELIGNNLLFMLRPLHVCVRETFAEIRDSPWMRLLNNNNTANGDSLAATAAAVAANFPGTFRGPPGNTSPLYLPSIPATPLSAALGPAAQATVPSTPVNISGGLDRSFQGDVFQRADSLLNLQQTMVYRR